MSLIRRKKILPFQPEDYKDDELITLREAAEILRLHESTIRKRRGGTQDLTHIPQGSPGSKRPRIMLVRSEVLAHRHRLIEEARSKTRRADEMVWGIK